MNSKDVLKELKALGTAQNRKVYGRHGVTREMFGVSYANLGKMKKKLKTNHALAQGLWASGIHDARVLATMIADPDAVKSTELDAWARELDSYVIGDAFAAFVAKTPFAQKKTDKWAKSKGEWTGMAGWNLVTVLAGNDDSLPDTWFEEKLAVIENEVHSRKNRVRYSMNMALIGIGIRNAKLERRAVAVAKHIGKVEVDHGETGCKTPDPIPYMAKAKARRKAKKR